MLKWLKILKRKYVYINRYGIKKVPVQTVGEKQYIDVHSDLFLLCADGVARRVDKMMNVTKPNDLNVAFMDLEYKYWEK